MGILSPAACAFISAINALLLDRLLRLVLNRLRPVNVVRGIPMPHPADERWHKAPGRVYCRHGYTDYGWLLTGTKIQLTHDCCALIDGTPMKARRYVNAVKHAQG